MMDQEQQRSLTWNSKLHSHFYTDCSRWEATEGVIHMLWLFFIYFVINKDSARKSFHGSDVQLLNKKVLRLKTLIFLQSPSPNVVRSSAVNVA